MSESLIFLLVVFSPLIVGVLLEVYRYYEYKKKKKLVSRVYEIKNSYPIAFNQLYEDIIVERCSLDELRQIIFSSVQK